MSSANELQQILGSLAGVSESRDRLARTVAALPDRMLNLAIPWQGTEQPLEQVLERHSAYQPPRARIRETLASLGWDAPAAVRHLQWAPIARARLEASLVGVPDVLLDVHPFPGEWSLRQQLAHVELTDIRYSIATHYAVHRQDSDPLAAPPEAYPAREANPLGNAGESLADILARMRGVRAAALAPLLDISAEQLLQPTEWHTAVHTIGFRLHRFAQHDLELATDIQRTLAAAGYRAIRPVALAAALVEAWGELAAILLGVPAEIYDAQPPASGITVREHLQALSAADERLIESIH